MAKRGSDVKIEHVVKRTKQGGKVKRATMNKHEKRTYKVYKGQGR